jgi:hypothetical protein
LYVQRVFGEGGIFGILKNEKEKMAASLGSSQKRQ